MHVEISGQFVGNQYFPSIMWPWGSDLSYLAWRPVPSLLSHLTCPRRIHNKPDYCRLGAIAYNMKTNFSLYGCIACMSTEAGRGPQIPWDRRYRWFVSCHVGTGNTNINLHVELGPISLRQLFICICQYEEKTNIFLGVAYMFMGVCIHAQALWHVYLFVDVTNECRGVFLDCSSP